MFFTPITTTTDNFNWVLFGSPVPSLIADALNTDDGDVSGIQADSDDTGPWSCELQLTNPIPTNVGTVRLKVTIRTSIPITDLWAVNFFISTSVGNLYHAASINVETVSQTYVVFTLDIDCSGVGTPGSNPNSLFIESALTSGAFGVVRITYVTLETVAPPPPPSSPHVMTTYDYNIVNADAAGIAFSSVATPLRDDRWKSDEHVERPSTTPARPMKPPS
jgi:hypothetical protein